ncbi:MAG: rod shape-determining protein MreD [Sphingomonas sp.]|nr:rod shape-determining protein MreD [Sphingomonas sp.]
MKMKSRPKGRLSRGSQRFRKGPVSGAQYWPPAMVLFASFFTLWPVVSDGGWWPDMALLVLIAWRLQRPLAFSPWFAPAAGLFNDLIAGHMIGLSVFTFSLALIVAELIERRSQWRDWLGEWLVAAVLIAVAELVQWQVAGFAGARAPVDTIAIPVLIAVLAYPVVSSIVTWVDKKRIRR